MSNFDEYKLNYWYDAQIRRYNIIFTRIFANLQYASDVDENGNPVLRRIPVRYALKDNLVAYVLRNANENSLLSVPMFTVNLTSIEYNRDRVVDPLFSEKVFLTEKEYDEEKKVYKNEPAESFSIERFSPVPYTLQWEVHLWTSNQLQKEQIVEQIIVLFNPSIQLQFSENPVDWTSLTEVFMDNIVYSNNSIPVGSKAEIEITTFNFHAPVWFSPPAILEKKQVIKNIITNIVNTQSFEENLEKNAYGVKWETYDLLSRQIVTPGNHSILIDGNSIYLANQGGGLENSENEIYSWKTLIDMCGGVLRPNTSLLMINPTNDVDLPYEEYIIGTIDYGTEENILIWNLDPLTIPQNTLDPIKAIIDPTKTYPGNGLSVPVKGDRYLLLNETSSGGIWGLTASKNDIIEYNGNNWEKVFNHEVEKESIHYMFNQYSNKQLKWNGKEWVFSIDGYYSPGQWRLAL